MFMRIYAHKCTSPKRTRGRHWILCSWSYSQLWAAVLCRCWELNSGPPQEPYTSLPAKSSLCPPHYKCSKRKKMSFNIQVLLIRNLLFMKKVFKKYVKFPLWMHQGQNVPVNAVVDTDWHEGGDTDEHTRQGPSLCTHPNGFNPEDCHRLTIVTHQ